MLANVRYSEYRPPEEWIEILKRELIETDQAVYPEVVEALDKAIEALKWIPCTEELPEHNVKSKGYGLRNVLVTYKYAGILRCEQAIVAPAGGFHIHGITRGIDEIIAWKPLPEPYEGDTK